MKTIALFVALALAGSIFGEEGERLVRELEAPDFVSRTKATANLGVYFEAQFQKAADQIAELGKGEGDWLEVREAVRLRAAENSIDRLRKMVKSRGFESMHRFASLDGTHNEAIRKAAVAAGLDAPGDFEAELIAQGSQNSGPVYAKFDFGARWTKLHAAPSVGANGMVATVDCSERVVGLSLAGSNVDIGLIARAAALPKLKTLTLAKIDVEPGFLPALLREGQISNLSLQNYGSELSEYTLRDLSVIDSLATLTVSTKDPKAAREIVAKARADLNFNAFDVSPGTSGDGKFELLMGYSF